MFHFDNPFTDESALILEQFRQFAFEQAIRVGILYTIIGLLVLIAVLLFVAVLGLYVRNYRLKSQKSAKMDDFVEFYLPVADVQVAIRKALLEGKREVRFFTPSK